MANDSDSYSDCLAGVCYGEHQSDELDAVKKAWEAVAAAAADASSKVVSLAASCSFVSEAEKQQALMLSSIRDQLYVHYQKCKKDLA
jgi:hypothetical protein